MDLKAIGSAELVQDIEVVTQLFSPGAPIMLEVKVRTQTPPHTHNPHCFAPGGGMPAKPGVPCLFMWPRLGGEWVPLSTVHQKRWYTKNDGAPKRA